MQLDCVAQDYAWGIKGEQSAVARFKWASDPSFAVSEDKCYAELWMGTHPSGPAKLVSDGKLLSSYLNDKPDAVGIVPENYPTNNLPFLFKVLSVRTALSVQAHPDKKRAEQLHQKFPDVYKDPNHKPEMVIALTPFECLCGFRTIQEIHQHFEHFPEFVAAIDHHEKITEEVTAAHRNNRSDQDEHLLKSLLAAFMSCPAALATHTLVALVDRLTFEQQGRSLTPLEGLLLRLHAQYPGDVGVFAPLLMNYLCLQPGESFFIGANELHAYVSGECVECMALSDNVVRAGLTPKFKDVETLCSMVVYKSRQPDFLTPQVLDGCTSLYRPPVDQCAEFEVELIEIPPHTASYRPLAVPCGCLLLLLKGGAGASSGVIVANEDDDEAAPTTNNTNTNSGADSDRDSDSVVLTTEDGSQAPLRLREGAVVFTAAHQRVAISTGSEGATFYRAHVNLTDTSF